MLMTFCAATRVKAILQHPDAPEVVKTVNRILQHCTGMGGGKSPNIDVFCAITEDKVGFSVGHGKVTKVDTEVKRALERLGVELQDGTEIKTFLCFTAAGKQYATRAVTQSNCNIFWEETTGKLVPGIIKSIFAVQSINGERNFFIAVRKNLPIPSKTIDPFNVYTDFGASLWADEYMLELSIFRMLETMYCHAIIFPWEAGVLIMKPLNWVSQHQMN